MKDRDPETWMWERARAILEQADRMSRRPSRPPGSGAPCPSWEPPFDVFETPTELWIVVSLPGVEPARVEVTIEGRGLVVRGERPLPSAFRQAAIHRLEIPHGRFERSIALPPGTYELGQRDSVDGCLFLSLRKID